MIFGFLVLGEKQPKNFLNLSLILNHLVKLSKISFLIIDWLINDVFFWYNGNSVMNELLQINLSILSFSPRNKYTYLIVIYLYKIEKLALGSTSEPFEHPEIARNKQRIKPFQMVEGSITFVAGSFPHYPGGASPKKKSKKTQWEIFILF